METKTKQVLTGKRPTITILPSDLAKLKEIKRDGESLYMTLHRVIAEVKNV